MANDELEAMVRDELLWDSRVDSDAVAVSANDAGVKASPGSATPDQRQIAAMWSPSPDRRLPGSCRTAIPARWSLLEPVQI
jgi:hypothetical protein